MKQYAYHQWSLSDTEKHFGVGNKEGLSDKEANFRLQKFGPNSLAKISSTNIWQIFIRQFKNLFIILLIAASIISYFVDGLSQALILIAIVIVNLVVGLYQEFKAEKSLSALKKSLAYHSRVLREGTIKEIDSENVVSGDIVILREGDKIPADLRLFEEKGLRMDESSLTGESAPVSKHVKVIDIDTPLAERYNLAFAGTTVFAGFGRGIVTSTGQNTEFGKIAEMISGEEENTPLKKRVAYISQILFYVALALSLTIFALGLYRGWETLKLLTFVIALFIAAVPESLPTVITLALAIGVSEMAKKKAIVRRLAVIEALGSVNIIATDKTGTLTKNELQVEKLSVWQRSALETSSFDRSSQKQSVLLLFASYASSISGNAEEGFDGDPLEVAIMKSLQEISPKLANSRQKFELKNEVPFDSDKKYMQVSGRIEKQDWLVIKGAVEKVMPFCSLKKWQKLEIENELLKLSRKGLKSIAVCRKKINKSSFSDPKSMEFLGILGFIDEPNEGVAESIKNTIAAGIRPIIITGDNPHTSQYIAEEIGLKIERDEIISGAEIEKLSDTGLRENLKKVKIFARATPADKIRIVEMLEKMGYVVAVTGDGVNDAPALKTATVGISMGKRGSDVSREASDIILADDNYSTIISAIAYGRIIYDNIKNAIVFLLAGNFDELFLIALAFAFNLPAPMTVVQILWVNLITDSLPAMALAFEKPKDGRIQGEPRSTKKSEIKSSLVYAGWLGLFAFVTSVILYLWGLHDSVARARTMVFTAAVIHEMSFVFSIRSKSRFWQNFYDFFQNKFMLVSICAALLLQSLVLIPSFQPFFGTTSLSGVEIFVLITTTILAFFYAEVVRYFIDKKQQK